MKNIKILKAIIFIFFSIIVFLSLFSYSPKDIYFLSYPYNKSIKNFIGIIGAYLGFFLFFLFGYISYFFSLYLLLKGLEKINLVRFYGIATNRIVKFFSFLLFVIFLAGFFGLFNSKISKFALPFSGVIGLYLSDFFKKYFGTIGSFIIFGLFLVLSSSLLFSFFFVDVFILIKKLLKKRHKKIIEPLQTQLQTQETLKNQEVIMMKAKEKPKITIYQPKIKPQETKQEAKQEEKKPFVEEKTKVIQKDQKIIKEYDSTSYKLPTYDILKPPPLLDYRELKENIEENIKNLEETLLDFGVQAKVVSVQRGPVVTMYELEPEAGVKITKISSLSDDIALAMKTSSVRVVAPIPGKGTVGIEVPNEKKHFVYLREVLEEKFFWQLDSKLALALGKDVSGNPVICDLKELPHLLIAGTTGSGKTVCVNSIISSILFKAKPDEVKFILIDPKMVELAPFNNIPHLLSPIIFDAKKAQAALNWAVQEMERRYQILAEEGVRNIELYNKTTKKTMPYIVIVVDELADLMVVAKDNIETFIQRLAQLSRAVGIHLILATQRPSVDVITGVIKANFPARISFKVSSKVDSRTVLDVAGAEKLLGKGDLLFLKPSASKLIRAQGSFIDDEDIDNLTNFIKSQGGPVYEGAIDEIEKKATFDVSEDELFDEAVKIILEARQASASILQRRLRVGYTRAARLLDLMEKAGIVGPFCGSKPREILVEPESYLKNKN